MRRRGRLLLATCGAMRAVGVALACGLSRADAVHARRPSAWRRRDVSSTATRSSSTIDGSDERVRLIGIDTPETVKPRRARRVLRPRGVGASPSSCCPAGTPVRLERDVEARDDYGRLLAYVYRLDDGIFVNLEIVRRRVRHAADASRRTSPTPTTSSPRRRAAEQDGLGLWAACARIASTGR